MLLQSPLAIGPGRLTEEAAMILIVDDQFYNREPLKRLLNRNGYRAETASNGEEALWFTKMVTPELVVLDEMMPGMSGMDVLRKLRSDPKTKDVPVIFYSAIEPEDKRREARELGAVAWLAKGYIHWSELIERIESICGEHAGCEREETFDA
jgi:CheY-like chemotaxis protein